MIPAAEQLDYIDKKLAFFKAHVILKSKSGLYDINKIGEDIFMELLNIAFDWKLENANNILGVNYPAIDLIDEENKIVVQVTSSEGQDKIYTTVKKLNELKANHASGDVQKKCIPSDYELKMFYLGNMPVFSSDIEKKVEALGVGSNRRYGIDAISKVARSNLTKAQKIYETLKKRMDAKSFRFDIKGYLESKEPHLRNETYEKFNEYKQIFESFMDKRDEKYLAIYSLSGLGKTHLLRYFSQLQNEYTPIIFTNEGSIKIDLQSLDDGGKYLFLYDDIDEFLNDEVVALLSFVNTHDIKLIFTSKLASKDNIKNTLCKFKALKGYELILEWTKAEISNLIKFMYVDASEYQIYKTSILFNNNPYLISISRSRDFNRANGFTRKFSNSALDVLKSIGFEEKETKELLAKIAIKAPSGYEEFNDGEIKAIKELKRVGIVRELNGKIRFYVEEIGKVYLEEYMRDYIEDSKELISEDIADNALRILENAKYVFQSADTDEIKDHFVGILKVAKREKKYKNSYLKIASRLAMYRPEDVLAYLEVATKKMVAKEGLYSGEIARLYGVQYSMGSSFINDEGAINIEVVALIVDNLILALQCGRKTDRFDTRRILNYLTSDEVLSMPWSLYENTSLSALFNTLTFPDEKHIEISIDTLNEMKNWLEQSDISLIKADIALKCVANLLSCYAEIIKNGFRVFVTLDFNNKGILKVISKGVELAVLLTRSSHEQVRLEAVKFLSWAGLGLKDLNMYELKVLAVILNNMLYEILTQYKSTSDYVYKYAVDSILFESQAQPLKTDTYRRILFSLDRSDEYVVWQFVAGCSTVFYDCEKVAEALVGGVLTPSDYAIDLNSEVNIKYVENVVDRLFNEGCSKDGLASFLNNISHGLAHSTIEDAKNDGSEYSESNFIKVLDLCLEKDSELLKSIDLSSIENEIASGVLKHYIFKKKLMVFSKSCLNDDILAIEAPLYIGLIFEHIDVNTVEHYESLEMLLEFAVDNSVEVLSSVINSITYRASSKINNNTSLYVAYSEVLNKMMGHMIEKEIKVPLFFINILTWLKRADIECKELEDGFKELIEQDRLKPYNKRKLDRRNLEKLYSYFEYDALKIADIITSKLYAKEFKNSANIMGCFVESGLTIREPLFIQKYVTTYEEFKRLFKYILKEEKINKLDGLDLNYYFYEYDINFLNKLVDESIENKDCDSLLKVCNIISFDEERIEMANKIIGAIENSVDPVLLSAQLTSSVKPFIERKKAVCYAPVMLHNRKEYIAKILEASGNYNLKDALAEFSDEIDIILESDEGVKEEFVLGNSY